VVHITDGVDRLLFYVNLLVPVFLPLRAGTDQDDPIQEKHHKSISIKEVNLQRGFYGIIR
jgi:hypothetical protein